MMHRANELDGLRKLPSLERERERERETPIALCFCPAVQLATPAAEYRHWHCGQRTPTDSAATSDRFCQTVTTFIAPDCRTAYTQIPWTDYSRIYNRAF